MITCWTCTKTNNCKKIPESIQKIKSHVCEKYSPISDEETQARNTILTSIGPLKTVKVLKTHRRVNMSMNPVVQKIIDLVQAGDVAAVQAMIGQAEFINSHLMIAACKITDDPPGVSKQLADAKDDRRGKLIEILASAAAGMSSSPVAASSAEAAIEEPAPVEEPKRRGRKPASAAVAPTREERAESAGTDAVSEVIARIDAVGQGQDEIGERLKKLEESVQILTIALSKSMGMLDVLGAKLDVFKTGILNAELEMLGAGKIGSAPFGEAAEAWPKD